MSRFDPNGDPVRRLDYAATNWMKDERPPEPCRVVRADQTPVCPPCQSRVTYSEWEIIETCVKCGNERRRPRFGELKVNNKAGSKEFEVFEVVVGDATWGDKKKLTDDQVREIRSSKLSYRKLAAKFGVHHSTVYQVRKGENYAGVE